MDKSTERKFGFWNWRNRTTFFSMFAMNGKRTTSFLIECCLCIALWVAALFLLGSPFPFDYDSVNYSLAMVKDFDIRVDQPHAPGYIFHIAFGRLLLPLIDNPIRVQQTQNLIYLTIALLCLAASKKRKPGDLFFFASLPLLVFLACVPVIHAANLAAASLLAWSIFKVKKGEMKPLAPLIVLSISVGFRQDLMLFLGPVALWAFLREGLDFRRTVLATFLCLILTAAWYLPTRWLSGGASPSGITSTIFNVFAGPSSFLMEGSAFEAGRKALRFLLYGIGVFGPAGLALLLRKPLKPLGMDDRIILLLGTLPSFLFLLFVFGPRSTYYATTLGFFITWCFLNYGLPWNRIVVGAAVVANLAFFWLVPLPNYERGDAGFFQRTWKESTRKQISYIGANGRAVIGRQRNLLTMANVHLRDCSTFGDRSNVTDGRIWAYMAERVWHNRYGGPAGCVVGKLDPQGPAPIAQTGGIGIWHTDSGTHK